MSGSLYIGKLVGDSIVLESDSIFKKDSTIPYGYHPDTLEMEEGGSYFFKIWNGKAYIISKIAK